MSINKIECSGGRLTLHGDYVVYHQDDVQFELEGDGVPGFLKGSRKGNIFISTNRVIFALNSNCNVGSFSMNFQSIRGVEVKQPIFGANYIKGDVISEPEGGWQGRGSFRIMFNSGGAIEFAEHFRQAVQTARRPNQVPPMAPAGQQAAFAVYNNPYPPPPPQPGYYYGPPPQGFYPQYTPGMQMGQPPPYNPPENPPPYPGTAAPSAPPSSAYGGPQPDGAKAREAYSSGQNVYVPASQYPPYAPPPPYTPDKKND
ncbi:WW domain-binding protein 2 [Nematostella vectensis]|uniref:WW domain-binding protein 2 n=1 Tax=Nematostella vectensis TaxID=45351 RepID=UPI00207783CD|nr:WW domain-binding protein 2 [Nematostella vectensis]